METASNAKELLRQFILEKLAKTKNFTTINNQDNLIENGIIDSLGIVQLVSFIENTFTIKIKDEDIIPDYFESIDAISHYIEQLQ
jgi:acyl carrier protein